jgi:hypothetical protein
MANADRIRQLNDKLRTTFRGGKIAITPGVMALGDLPTILKQLREFSAFTSDCDPEGVHDFGAFKYNGASHITGEGPLIFFKFDYYDKELMFGSPNAANPEVTCRICTLMLSSEY